MRLTCSNNNNNTINIPLGVLGQRLSECQNFDTI
jgi:hypothetical protein